jgi:hypothetical protein
MTGHEIELQSASAGGQPGDDLDNVDWLSQGIA